MIGFNRPQKHMTDAEYQAEYRRLLRELDSQFAVGDSPQEQVVQAMSLIDREMNGNGGCNWVESDYVEYLDTLREHLLSEKSFTPEQIAKTQWSLEEIIGCGRELEQRGESSRNATEAVAYLILRVVDWIRLHPKVKTMSHPRDFFFEGMEVGYFEETNMPRAAGRFRYMPYRGPGHYEMQTQRRAGGSPRCYYDTEDARVSFTVRDCPEYGVLELCDFEISPRNG